MAENYTQLWTIICAKTDVSNMNSMAHSNVHDKEIQKSQLLVAGKHISRIMNSLTWHNILYEIEKED